MKALTLAGACTVALMVMLFVMGLITSALPARAQSAPQCGPWDVVAAGLLSKYQEPVLFEGTPGPGGQRIVITAKPDGTTWTALTVSATGLACVRGAGGGWSMGAPVAQGVPG